MTRAYRPLPRSVPSAIGLIGLVAVLPSLTALAQTGDAAATRPPAPAAAQQTGPAVAVPKAPMPVAAAAPRRPAAPTGPIDFAAMPELTPSIDIAHARTALRRHDPAAADAWIEHAETQLLNAAAAAQPGAAPAAPAIRTLEAARSDLQARRMPQVQRDLDSAAREIGKV